MAVYTKSMMEALAEVRLQEDNMDLMRKAAGGAMQTIKMKDGKLKMDSFTASGIMQVYDKVNPKNKKAMEQMINSGKKSQIMKLQALALKAGYNEEAELDEAVGAWTIKMPPAEGGNRVDDVSTHSIMGFIKRKGGSNRDIQAIKKGNDVTFQGTTGAFYKITKEEAELDEGDPFMGPTKGKGKVVTVRHKTSGKELAVTANSVKKYEKMGYEVVKETTEIGERVAEQLSKIRGNTPLKEDENEAYELGTNEYREYLEKLTPGESEEVELKDDFAKFQKFARLYGGGDEIYIVTQGKDSNSQKVIGIDKDPKKAIKIRDNAKGPKARIYGQMKKSQQRTPMKVGDDVSFEDQKNKLTFIEEVDLDEASARADAMRAMRRGKDVDPADVDVDASDADVKAASKNILAQMRKASNLGGRFEVEFLDKKKVKVKLAIANAFIKKYESMRKPADKEKFQNQAMKSYKDLLKVLKAGYNEEVKLDEALPSHLKKHFDKDGNPKTKEGKAAWERLATSKGYRKYTSKQIKMAIGVAFDKRYVQGNMTGAAKTIEKIAKGLSEIEPVANALRRANENTILDRIDRKLKERKNG